MIGVGACSSNGLQAELRKHFRDTPKTERRIRRTRMNLGAKDIRDYMNKSRTDAPNGPQGNEVEEVRTRALSQWTPREQREAREALLEKQRQGGQRSKGVSVGHGVYLRAREQEYQKLRRIRNDFEIFFCWMVQSQRKPLSEMLWLAHMQGTTCLLEKRPKLHGGCKRSLGRV